MDGVTQKIRETDWERVAGDLHDRGYAVLPGFLNDAVCQDLVTSFAAQTGFRKTVVMERYRFGKGVYKYWDYPLPDLVQSLREEIYPHLVPVANAWMQMLNIDKTFPDSLAALQSLCAEQGQKKPTPLILEYGTGGYNTLHQDLYGDVYFPLQTACFLNIPGLDYTGGEFVLTQQVPRAQSKAVVLTPGRGDMVIFTTSFRPVKSTRGYYRAAMRHGVSEVHSGKRHVAGIIFHDAES